jgi:hypothetical protein
VAGKWKENTNIMFLDIIRRLGGDVSETVFCLRLQVNLLRGAQSTELVPIPGKKMQSLTALKDMYCCKVRFMGTELFGFFWTLSIVWYVEVLQKTTTYTTVRILSSLSRFMGLRI